MYVKKISYSYVRRWSPFWGKADSLRAHQRLVTADICGGDQVAPLCSWLDEADQRCRQYIIGGMRVSTRRCVDQTCKMESWWMSTTDPRGRWPREMKINRRDWMFSVLTKERGTKTVCTIQLAAMSPEHPQPRTQRWNIETAASDGRRSEEKFKGIASNWLRGFSSRATWSPDIVDWELRKTVH